MGEIKFNKIIHKKPMKKLTIFSLLIVGALFLIPSPVVLAADIAHGREIFSAQCALCHVGGKNVINPNKTL